MRKTVKGAEPLRAVGTSLSGPAFANEWHMRTRHGRSDSCADAPERGFCQGKLSQVQKIGAINLIVSKFRIVTARRAPANVRQKQ
jgi:hypothetical protein